MPAFDMIMTIAQYYMDVSESVPMQPHGYACIRSIFCGAGDVGNCTILHACNITFGRRQMHRPSVRFLDHSLLEITSGYAGEI